MNELVYQLFDVTSYLSDKGVSYITEGNEVTQGWIGTQCLWCDDKSYHLGINLLSNWISCWRCGKKGSIALLVKKIEHHSSFSETMELMEKYQDFSRMSLITDREETIRSISIKIPDHFQKLDWPWVPPIVNTFLKFRGFDPQTICRGKELYYGGHIGRFRFRLILPVKYKGRLMSYIGRDVTGKSSIPYLNLEDEKCALSIKDSLYGYDEVPPGGNLIVVEGPLDQWKLGAGAVATFGTQWTMKQVAKIRELKPNKVFILFDTEKTAQESAKRLASQIWWCDCEVMELEGANDPGDLPIELGQTLMNLLKRG